MTFTITGSNENPVAAKDILYVSNSTTVTLSLSTLLGNDTDVDGLALRISSFSAGYARRPIHLGAKAER